MSHILGDVVFSSTCGDNNLFKWLKKGLLSGETDVESENGANIII